MLTAAGIEPEEIDWREYAPYTCGDRQQQAWWDACGDVDACLRVLLGGHAAASQRTRTTQKAGA